jgi:hypothetical protein
MEHELHELLERYNRFTSMIHAYPVASHDHNILGSGRPPDSRPLTCETPTRRGGPCGLESAKRVPS